MEAETTTAADPILFNSRFQITVAPSVTMLSVKDESIEARKRKAYVSRLKSKATAVPVVDIDATHLFHGRPPLLELARFAKFTHHSTRKEKSKKTWFYDESGMIYDIFMTARGNGLYSCFLEMPQRDSDAKLLYMPEPITEKEIVRRGKFIAVIQEAVREWARLCQRKNAERDIKERVRGILANNKLTWMVSACNWATYVNHCLFDKPESRLYLAGDRLLHNRFRIVALDPDNETKYQWESLVRAYLKGNPAPSQRQIDRASSQSSMVTLPFPYAILNHKNITLVALDCADANNIVMAGYTTCSVRANGTNDETVKTINLDPFHSEELNQFVRKMSSDASNGKERNDCGFDILSIDGAHVPHSYRGQGLFPTMLQYVMEFVANSHRTLGVSLVIADSLAAATKSELVKLRFSHYNVVTALQWLNLALIDYVKKLDGVENPDYQTPEKLLTLQGIYGLIEGFCSVYTNGTVKKESAWVQKANKKLDPIKDDWKQWIERPPETKFLRRNVRKRIETIAKLVKEIENSQAFEAYDRRVKHLLDSEDTEDTLFFIDKSLTDDEIFVRKAPQPQPQVTPVPEKNEEEDLRQAEPRPTVPITEKQQLFDTRPDAEDLALYDMWLLVDKPPVVAANPVARPAPVAFVLTEEERLREARSIAAEEKYIRSLVQGLNRQIGATRLYINLQRNRPGQ